MADRVQECVLESVPSAADIAGLFEALIPPISAKTAAAIDDPMPPPPEESTPGQQKDSDVEFTERGHRDLPLNVNDDTSSDTEISSKKNWSASGSDTSDAEKPPPPSPKKKRGRPPLAPGQSKKERVRAQRQQRQQKFRDRQEPSWFRKKNLYERNARAARKEARQPRKKDWRLSAGAKDIHKNTKGQGRLNLKFDAATQKRHRDKASRAIQYIRENLSGGRSEEFESVVDAVAQQSRKRKQSGPVLALLYLRSGLVSFLCPYSSFSCSC